MLTLTPAAALYWALAVGGVPVWMVFLDVHIAHGNKAEPVAVAVLSRPVDRLRFLHPTHFTKIGV